MEKHVTWGCRTWKLFSLLESYGSLFFLDLCELFCSQLLTLQTTKTLGYQDIWDPTCNESLFQQWFNTVLSKVVHLLLVCFGLAWSKAQEDKLDEVNIAFVLFTCWVRGILMVPSHCWPRSVPGEICQGCSGAQAGVIWNTVFHQQSWLISWLLWGTI